MCNKLMGEKRIKKISYLKLSSKTEFVKIFPVNIMNIIKGMGRVFGGIDKQQFLRTIDNKTSAMSRHQGNHDGYTKAIKNALDKIDLNGYITKQVSQIQEMARKGLSNGMPIRALDLHPAGDILGNNRAYQLWSKILN